MYFHGSILPCGIIYDMKLSTSKGILLLPLVSIALFGAGCLSGFKSGISAKPIPSSEFKPPMPPTPPSAEPEIPKEAEKIPRPY